MKNRAVVYSEIFLKSCKGNKNTFIYILRLIITIFLVLLILLQVDFHVILQTISSANLTFIMIAVLLYYPVQLISSYRWYYLLVNINKEIPYLSIIRYHFIGQISTFLLPGQISGDLVRFIGVSSKKPGKLSFAYSILMDKMSFLVALAGFASLGIFGSGAISEMYTIHIFAFSVLIVSLGLLCFIGIFRNTSIIIKFYSVTNNSFIQNLLSNLIYKVSSVPKLNYKILASLLTFSFVIQLINATGSYLIIRSLGTPIYFLDWAVINAIVAIILVLPITIAGIGVREGLLVYILSMYQISPSQTVSYSVLSMSLIVILITIGFLLLENINKRLL
jgi:glycosyltransferase 2 family protein